MKRIRKSSFSFAGEPGEFISGGRSESYSEPDAKFSARQLEGKNAIELSIDAGEKRHWRIEFAGPNGKRLRTQHYTDARRYAFYPDLPALTLMSYGRGNNQNFGEFTIHRIRFNRAGELLVFAADFVQHMERPNGPAVRGTIIYRKPKTR